MLACSAMVACTNDDLLENNENLEGAEGKAYVSVKLVSSASNQGRSVTDSGYEAANPELEKKIDGSKSIFLFYEENGKWVTSGVISTQTPSGTDANDGDKSDAVANDVEGEALIVLQGTEQQLNQCTKVLTVINYSDCDGLKQLTLQQALEKIATTTADPALGTENKGFLMATSVYKDANGKIINYTPVTTNNICATPALAKAAPVIVHVERAAAKVNVKVTATGDDLKLGVTGTTNADKGIVVDGTITPVQITIDGWTLNGINQSTNIVKKLDNAWKVSGTTNTDDVPFTDWNNTDDYRSFWAMSTNYDESQSLDYKTYTEANTSAGESVLYCYENNVDDYIINYNTVTQNHKVTTALIKAHFNLLGTDGTQEAAQTLYEFNGVYYKEANYKKLILKQLKDAGYRVITETTTDGKTTYEAATIEESALGITTDGTLAGIQFTLTDATSPAYYAQVVVDVNGEVEGDVTFQKNDSGTELKNLTTATLVDDFINDLDYVKEAQAYENGQCYYQVPIEHLAATEGVKTYKEENGTKTYKFVEGYYGVIRNHHYVLSISAIKNIGEPVYNESVDITDIPAKLVDYYMAAELHVLNWKVVSQDVEL